MRLFRWAIRAGFSRPPLSSLAGFLASTEAARLNMGLVWAAILVAAVAGSVLYGLLGWIERRVTFWHPSIRRAGALSEALFSAWDDALLFRKLATLRLDVPVFETIADLRWQGPSSSFEEYARRMKSPELLRRARATGSPSAG